jgi:hypothetical protein
MGVPLRAWEDYRYVLGLDAPDGLLGFGPTVLAIDPTYVNDFWTQPGYLGTEQSALGDMFRAARTPANESTLALLVYHRYQVPADPSFHAWDQFRNPDGTPIYPQRPIQIGPLISATVTGGGTFTGNIHGKVIVVDNLLDTDAFPWDGDWYSGKVKQALGAAYGDNFRLWYNDNTDHIGARTPRLIDYSGILQQALRDVSAWAEQGVAPARSTRYDITDNQITVPDNAADRRGIQPVVDLTVGNGTAMSIDVAAGQPVTFKAKVQVPPNTGQIVSAEWDLPGDGSFTTSDLAKFKPTLELTRNFTYTTPGTYFAALRVTSQRDGDPTSPFTKVQNLGRVRVVVH